MCNRGGTKECDPGPGASIYDLALTNNIIAEGKTNATVKVAGRSVRARRAAFPASLEQQRTAQRSARASTAPALRRRFAQMLIRPGSSTELAGRYGTEVRCLPQRVKLLKLGDIRRLTTKCDSAGTPGFYAG